MTTGTVDSTAPRIAVLISGRGSNLQSIIDAIADRSLDATLALVVSNRSEAAGLARARDAGIEALCLSQRDYRDRDAYDRAIVTVLRAHKVDLVCLAGFMRLVGTPMLEAFPQRILNIHPSLLPAFPGLDAQQQALAHGVRVSGATVHVVTPELDGGPIILQAPVPVLDDDTVETLSARILVEEHRIYPEAIRVVLRGGWRLEGRRFIAARSIVRLSRLPVLFARLSSSRRQSGRDHRLHAAHLAQSPFLPGSDACAARSGKPRDDRRICRTVFEALSRR